MDCADLSAHVAGGRRFGVAADLDNLFRAGELRLGLSVREWIRIYGKRVKQAGW